MTGDVRLRILGPLRVGRDGDELDPGPYQQRSLLALLLANVGQPVGMTELIDLLWGPLSPSTAVNVIHKYVGALRRLLEPGLPPRAPGRFVLRHGNGYRFVAGAAELDLIAFRTLAARAAAARPAEALELYEAALALGHGPAGAGLADTPAARSRFASLDAEFLAAVLAAAGLALRLHVPARVLAPLRRAAESAPFHEIVQATLVTTLAAAGQQAEAVTAYRTIRERLADELGIDPGQELLRAYRQVLAPAAATPVHPAQLPPDLPLFTGRTRELATLDRLAGRAGPAVIALDGAAGAGTSTLAVHFAHRVAARFPDGQLYLDLHGNRPDGDALRSLLHGLGVRTPDLPGTVDAQVGTYRSLTAGKRVLVLLDNVQDASRVRALLPGSPGSLVLITGRHPLLDLAARDGAHLLHVDVPDPSAARELLERRLSQPPGSRELMDEIVELCGRLPLALALLAARLSTRPGQSLASIASDLRAGR